MAEGVNDKKSVIGYTLGIMPKYLVTIRENATGKTAEHVHEARAANDELFSDDYLAVAIWDRGNYSCDCNRELDFRRALGESPEWVSVPCSEGRFSVQLRTEDGKVLLDELSAGGSD